MSRCWLVVGDELVNGWFCVGYVFGLCCLLCWLCCVLCVDFVFGYACVVGVCCLCVCGALVV